MIPSTKPNDACGPGTSLSALLKSLIAIPCGILIVAILGILAFTYNSIRICARLVLMMVTTLIFLVHLPFTLLKDPKNGK